jgi:hypothetical protein
MARLTDEAFAAFNAIALMATNPHGAFQPTADILDLSVDS